MITVDKGFIASFINKQSHTESEASITEHSNVSVLLSQLCLIITKTFANFVEILYAYKSKDITHFVC